MYSYNIGFCVGLNTINRLTRYETSYQNQFPGYWFQPDDDIGVQNVLVLDDSTNDDKATTEQQHDNENVCFITIYTHK